MLKAAIIGAPLHVDSRRIVAQDGAAIVTYSRDWYRLAQEPERRIDWTAPEMDVLIGPEGHGVLVTKERR